MKIKMFYRHYGVHKLRRELDINGDITDYVKDFNVTTEEGVIDEGKLLKNISSDFLGTSPDKILLTIGDGESGSTGQRGLKKFRNWSKYFDSLCLELVKEQPNDQG